MLRAVSVIVLSLVATLGISPPGHAESKTVRDSRHDVSAIDFSDCAAACPVVSVQRRNRVGDVTRMSARLGPKALRLVLGVRALNPHPAHRTLVGWEVHTPGHQAQNAVLIRHGREARLQIQRPGQQPSCRGATFSVHPRPRLYSVTIPVSCLGDAPWVRVGAGVLLAHRHAVLVIDDALDPDPSRGRRLKLTERIYAG